MIIDIEMTEDELDEFIDYWNLQKPIILKADEYSIKIKCTNKFKHYLDKDSIAYWDDGVLL